MGDKATEGKLRMGPGTHEVPLKMFAENRARLCKSLQKNPRTPPQSVVFMQGGDDINLYSTDVCYNFRQDSFFMWLFGVLEPGCYGSIDVSTGQSTVFVPHFPPEYAVWMGPLHPPEHFQKKYEVDHVCYVDEMKDYLKQNTNGVLLLIQGLNSDSKLQVKPAEFKGIEEFKINTEVLYPTICELRVIKTPLELEVLRYVTLVSSEAHKLVMRSVGPNCNEYEAESIFLAHCYGKGGCRHVSYTCICCTGENGAILHYGHAGAPNDGILRDGDMCLFDMGANYHGYAADITCSFPANGKFTADQKFIYNAVLAANLAVQRAARAGVSWVDMHLLSARTLLEHLKKGGLLKGSVDEMMSNHLYATFQPHGLGHLIGMDVHDVGGYLEDCPPRPQAPGIKCLRTARILKPGMVMTIEPGCYFIKPLLDAAKNDPNLSPFLNLQALDRFIDFGGVRIEDDVIITETGIENMTKVPRTVEEIESWMAVKECYTCEINKK